MCSYRMCVCVWINWDEKSVRIESVETIFLLLFIPHSYKICCLLSIYIRRICLLFSSPDLFHFSYIYEATAFSVRNLKECSSCFLALLCVKFECCVQFRFGMMLCLICWMRLAFLNVGVCVCVFVWLDVYGVVHVFMCGYIYHVPFSFETLAP